MRLTHKLALLCTLLTAGGCRKAYVVPETPMPPNTILLSQMLRQLSAQPGFNQTLVDQIEKSGKKGPALLTPRLLTELRRRIFGKDWQGLDRFPGWSMREINPTVRVAGHVAGKNQELESAAAVHPGSPPSSARDLQTRAYLDLGPYSLDKTQTVSLDQPSSLPGFTTQGIVTPLGMGVVRGDGPNALAAEHAESQRLADLLNRLAANALAGAQPFVAAFQGRQAATPQALVEVLAAAGEDVVVNDARYFANFGHFHYNGQDVMMPFWLNSGMTVPHTGGLFHKRRPLLVPAAHAELEWHVHGPRLNADVSYYFGVDGKSEWRTMDTLDQAWVLKRNAHEYRNADAVEVTRLAALLTVAYMHLHAAHPGLPFGGYYALGVCQDGVSAVEHKMTGQVTLFPNTADDALFNDPRDAELNALIGAIPKDREGATPQPERIFGSIPAGPGPSPATAFDTITIPGLASDLNAAYAAWQTSSRRRSRRLLYYAGAAAVAALVLLLSGRQRSLSGRQRSRI